MGASKILKTYDVFDDEYRINLSLKPTSEKYERSVQLIPSFAFRNTLTVYENIIMNTGTVSVKKHGYLYVGITYATLV